MSVLEGFSFTADIEDHSGRGKFARPFDLNLVFPSAKHSEFMTVWNRINDFAKEQGIKIHMFNTIVGITLEFKTKAEALEFRLYL